MYNDILETMPLEDLRQRYLDTYIKYDNEIVYVQDLAILGIRSPWEVAGHLIWGGGKRGVVAMDWTKLEMARPKAGWYIVNGTPAYLYLSDKKQYHRGSCEANIKVHTPLVNHATVDRFALLKEAYQPRKLFKTRVSQMEILDACKERGLSIVLQPSLLALCNKYHVTSLLYHTKPVAEMGQGQNQWTLLYPEFLDEIRESIFDFSYINLAEPTPKSRLKMPYKEIDDPVRGLNEYFIPPIRKGKALALKPLFDGDIQLVPADAFDFEQEQEEWERAQELEREQEPEDREVF